MQAPKHEGLLLRVGSCTISKAGLLDLESESTLLDVPAEK